MIDLIARLWHFITSPLVAALGSLASIAGVLYPFTIYVIRPLRVRYNGARAATLDRERSYLIEAQQDLSHMDLTAYWQDERYTPLEAAARPFVPVPPEFLLLSESRRSWWNALRSRTAPRRSTDLARLLQRHRDPVVVLGDPGAGKSVAIRHAMRRMITIAMRWYVVKPLLPLYVPCSYYTTTAGAHPVSVDAFLAEYVSATFPAFRSGRLDFAEYLRKGRLCIFFDALDEMPRADYAERVSRLREFAIRHSNNRINFSCRTLDYDPRLEVAEVRIRPFDDNRRKRFLKRVKCSQRAAGQIVRTRDSIGCKPRVFDGIGRVFSKAPATPVITND